MGQLLTTVGVQIVATSLWVIISVVEVLTGGLLLSGEDFHFQGRLSLGKKKSQS